MMRQRRSFAPFVALAVSLAALMVLAGCAATAGMASAHRQTTVAATAATCTPLIPILLLTVIYLSVTMAAARH